MTQLSWSCCQFMPYGRAFMEFSQSRRHSKIRHGEVTAAAPGHECASPIRRMGTRTRRFGSAVSRHPQLRLNSSPAWRFFGAEYNRVTLPGVSQGSISTVPWASATKATWDMQAYESTRWGPGWFGLQLMYEHDRKLADDFNSFTAALTYDLRIPAKAVSFGSTGEPRMETPLKLPRSVVLERKETSAFHRSVHRFSESGLWNLSHEPAGVVPFRGKQSDGLPKQSICRRIRTW